MVEMLRYLPDNSRILAYIIDKLGEANVSTERNTQIIAARFYHQIPQSEWYDPYTIIELFWSFNVDGSVAEIVQSAHVLTTAAAIQISFRCLQRR